VKVQFAAPQEMSMFRSIASPRSVTSVGIRLVLTLAFATALASHAFAAGPQEQDKDSQDKHLDIRSSSGDLHIGNDADGRKIGLPIYPGARLKRDNDNSNAVNLGLLTEAFGIRLVVASYESDAAPGQVVEYYREKLKKYGKVLECHTHEHGGDVHADVDDNDDKDDKDQHSKPVKCEGDNSGPVTELKVGTEDNQHVVAIEPRDGGKRATFALVYLHARGKQGDI
jgi:hypothetical protein